LSTKNEAAAKAPTFILPRNICGGGKRRGSVQLYCIDEIGL